LYTINHKNFDIFLEWPIY